MSAKMGRKEFLFVVFLFVCAFALTVVMLFATAKKAHAEIETSFTKDRTLIVKEIVGKGFFYKVPEGISADTAYKLATKKQVEATVVDENGSNEHSFALPWIKVRTEYMDKVVTYEKDGWLVKYAPSRFKQEERIFLSILWLWIPAVLIIIASIESAFARVPVKSFPAFYGLLLAGVFASALVGWFIGNSSGEAVGAGTGTFFGLIAGGFAGIFAGGELVEWGPDNPGLSVGLGGIAGALTAMVSGTYAGAQEFKIVMHCFLFLVGTEVVSFAIVLLIKSAQWKIQKIILGANKNIAT